MFFALLFVIHPLAKAQKRPNIFIAFADDWGKYASAYSGSKMPSPNDIIHTPNFDRIAREGVLFHNAFVPAPSCTPCRSAVLSGQYFWRTKRAAILQGAQWDFAIPSFPLLLKNAGYHIGHSYKVWTPGTPKNAPFGGKRFAYNTSGNRFNRFSQHIIAADDRKLMKNQLLDEVRNNFVDFISKRPEGSPFCYWFGPTNCHRKWAKGSGKTLWKIDPEKLKGKMPPFLPDAHAIREDFADYLGEIQAFDEALGVLIDELKKRNELDNTLIIVSGDHGIPGFPRGKCNLYDFGVATALAIRWGNEVKPNRELYDFINLMDIAPTCLEAASLAIPEIMNAKSMLAILKSGKSGQADSQKTFVITGRERHVAAARHGFLPYPQRAIRTADFLYIRNFRPERWPMGIAPGFGLPSGNLPNENALEHNTFAAFADLDASPTKAFLGKVHDRKDMQSYIQFAFGRRPSEELYDLKKDPHQMYNVASDSHYQKARATLADQLLYVLHSTGDPRVQEKGQVFEHPPYTNPVTP